MWIAANEPNPRQAIHMDTVYPEKFSFVLSNGLVLCEMRR